MKWKVEKHHNQPDTREAAEAWVKAGKPCIFVKGLWGKDYKKLTQQEAPELIKDRSWMFTMCFYELSWMEDWEGEPLVLEFRKLHENDLYC